MASITPPSTTQKITISLPFELAERFKTHIPPRQRSTLIAKILEEYLALEEQLNALEESAGVWNDENHPELMGEGGVDNWLMDLRSSWQPPSE